jgi:hypothetical protein
MSCPYRKWNLIAAAILAEACALAGEPVTAAMTDRFQAALREAQPFAHGCVDHLVDCDVANIEDPLVQPELVGAEALWRFMAGEAAVLESRLYYWLKIGACPDWADKALLYALEQFVYRMIAEEIVWRRHRRAA